MLLQACCMCAVSVSAAGRWAKCYQPGWLESLYSSWGGGATGRAAARQAGQGKQPGVPAGAPKALAAAKAASRPFGCGLGLGGTAPVNQRAQRSAGCDPGREEGLKDSAGSSRNAKRS